MTAHEWTALGLAVLATLCGAGALLAQRRRSQLGLMLFVMAVLYLGCSIYMLAVQP